MFRALNPCFCTFLMFFVEGPSYKTNTVIVNLMLETVHSGKYGEGEND